MQIKKDAAVDAAAHHCQAVQNMCHPGAATEGKLGHHHIVSGFMFSLLHLQRWNHCTELHCLQVMSKLAAEHQSVNLGQGFPDDEGPEAMKQVRTADMYSFCCMVIFSFKG
jgi:hypothetical protein